MSTKSVDHGGNLVGSERWGPVALALAGLHRTPTGRAWLGGAGYSLWKFTMLMARHTRRHLGETGALAFEPLLALGLAQAAVLSVCTEIGRYGWARTHWRARRRAVRRLVAALRAARCRSEDVPHASA